MDSRHPSSSNNGNKGLSFAPKERRAASRHLAVCRVARVTRAHDAGLWRVRNMSDDGLQLAADVPMATGEVLDIALSETISIRGQIVWVERGRCGVAFDSSVNAAAILQELAAEQQAEGYRALRLPVSAKAILMQRDIGRPIDLVDVSQQGAGYICDIPLEPGSVLELVLPGAALRRQALVRWSSGPRGGLWFTQPLNRADLESMEHWGGEFARRED